MRDLPSLWLPLRCVGAASTFLAVVSCDVSGGPGAAVGDVAVRAPAANGANGAGPDDGGIGSAMGAAANPTDASPFATGDAGASMTAEAASDGLTSPAPSGAIDAAASSSADDGASPGSAAEAMASSPPDATDASEALPVDAAAEASDEVTEAGDAAVVDGSPDWDGSVGTDGTFGGPPDGGPPDGGAMDASYASLADATSYSEATNGSFSSVNTAPTVVTVGTGSNLITGVVGGGSPDGEIDDYFEITVPAGAALTSIVLTSDASTSGPSDQTFFAVAQGTSISSSDSTAAGMLGWVLFDPGVVGTDLLPAMGRAGNGASGFTPPLGPGTYTFRVQDNDGSNAVSYQLELVLGG